MLINGTVNRTTKTFIDTTLDDQHYSDFVNSINISAFNKTEDSLLETLITWKSSKSTYSIRHVYVYHDQWMKIEVCDLYTDDVGNNK